MAKAYTLKKKKDTKELHIFKGDFTEGKKCNSEASSICNKMIKSESAGNKVACKNASEMRLECAQIGRAVCGSCVSHLYATY